MKAVKGSNLEKQIQEAQAEIATWPKWKREAGFEDGDFAVTTSDALTEQACEVCNELISWDDERPVVCLECRARGRNLGAASTLPMIPGDAVRKKAAEAADAIADKNDGNEWADERQDSILYALEEAYLAGHVEGRVEGMAEAARLLCSHCRRGEGQEHGHHLNCTDHEPDICSGCCEAWPLHHELACKG